MQIGSYQDLIAWQKAISFVKMVYVATVQFPREETFGLKSQMRRAAVSLPSNIAEGQGRASRGEFQQFLGQARGALYELETQITLASELGYFSTEQKQSLIRESRELGRILNGLMTSLKSPSSRMQPAQ